MPNPPAPRILRLAKLPCWPQDPGRLPAALKPVSPSASCGIVEPTWHQLRHVPQHTHSSSAYRQPQPFGHSTCQLGVVIQGKLLQGWEGPCHPPAFG